MRTITKLSSSCLSGLCASRFLAATGDQGHAKNDSSAFSSSCSGGDRNGTKDPVKSTAYPKRMFQIFWVRPTRRACAFSCHHRCPPLKQNIASSYDTEGNGEMTLGELAKTMGEVVGLTKEDVIPMFSQSGKVEDVSLIFI